MKLTPEEKKFLQVAKSTQLECVDYLDKEGKSCERGPALHSIRLTLIDGTTIEGCWRRFHRVFGGFQFKLAE